MVKDDWRRVKLTPAVRMEINTQIREMMYSKQYTDYLVSMVMNVIKTNKKAIAKMLVEDMKKEMKG